MKHFCHLHCHTQYSLLDGAAKVHQLIHQTKQLGMPGLAITDHGNMFGVPHFVLSAQKAGIKPIIGCEFYVASCMHDHKNKKRFHQVLLAKDRKGYQNLSRLCSLGFLEGYYYKPRIDKKLIARYAEGLIATSCCLASEVLQAIIQQGEAAAEKIFLSWLDIFGQDYYIELQRHGIKEQEICNVILMKWAKKYNVKVIATNDVHYVHQNDSVAQDILLCLQTGKDFHDPNRIRFENDQFYLKSPQEMTTLFQDIPEAIEHTQEIFDKVASYSLIRDILLPIYQLPKGFDNQDAYLTHLTWKGATMRYGINLPSIKERIEQELAIICSMGFAGYFLIVQDFVNSAKQLSVIIGPGRGSAAGSVVAYCIGITNIDPIQYDLLFERFLNADRISMPDIDIDFDDEGRQKVINYVVEKYGRNQVAQIITFGSMGAKSAIRDVARVLGLPLHQANYMAKLVPERLGTTLAQAFREVPELASLKKKIDSPSGRVLSFAETLEGSTRHTGIHAAGVIIAPDDLLQYIPVKTDKEADLLVTQYDGTLVESMGMLKMDFLGLKTLSIIRTALVLIEKKYHQKIIIDDIPLDDTKTFSLFQQGKTIAIFQFESENMRQWLQKLYPTHMDDLIAMNALYRPGPMQFIPNFIARKHGKETIEYPHPLLKDTLESTYGIMVYQEQIMKTAQIMAGYTLGEADILRSAMGKKKIEEMAKQRAVFIQGAVQKHQLSQEQANSIFEVMEKFAQYGFCKAHATAYSVIAYQTAYLKAHYPEEYMSAVLTHNQHDIDKISFFLEECKRNNIAILGPDINESHVNFDVNQEKKIRFGLSAIKGAGEAAVESIIAERTDNGPYKDIFDFVERVNLKTVNKKTLESLAMSGAFDSFASYHRRQYIFAQKGGNTLIENMIRYGNQYKIEKNTAQQSLFANEQQASYQPHPKVEDCIPYTDIEILKIEKEVVGFYISGHPLDQYQIDIQHFCNSHTQNVFNNKNRRIALAAIITKSVIRQKKNGSPYALFTIEDYEGTLDLALFGEVLRKYQHLLQQGEFVYIQGNVMERYQQKDVWELRISSIQLLSEIRAKLGKVLYIKLMIDSLDKASIQQYSQLLQAYPGTCLVKIILVWKEENMMVTTVARSYRINPTNDFFKLLTSIPSNTYQLKVG